MENAKEWVWFAIQLITTVVTIVWFFARLDKRIELLSQKMEGLKDDVKEIKENHLTHLSEDIKECNEKLTNHLINHNR